jgi:hypothetical protein
MNQETVDITEIMKTIKNKAAEREWKELPLTFEEFRESEDDGVRTFVEDEFREKVGEFQEICWVDYNTPIEGKCRFIKKIIKKLYSFHQRVLWQKQNEINAASAEMFASIKDYISGQNNQKLEELENKCREYETRIRQLEELVKK